MKIGIIGAMESEVTSLRDQLKDYKVTPWMGMELCEGALHGIPVALVRCGVGKVNAALNANALVAKCGATHIINTGVAGALDSRLDVGDIVVSTSAVEHDFDITALGYEPGLIPGFVRVGFVADKHMREVAVRAARAVASDAKVFEGCVASGDQFVASNQEKERIVSTFGALCCEMEGAAIAHTCYLMDVPYVAVRAISDKANGSSHVDFRTFEADAAKRCADIVLHMVGEL